MQKGKRGVSRSPIRAIAARPNRNSSL